MNEEELERKDILIFTVRSVVRCYATRVELKAVIGSHSAFRYVGVDDRRAIARQRLISNRASRTLNVINRRYFQRRVTSLD